MTRRIHGVLSRAALAVLLPLAALPGCIAVVDYHPDESAVEKLGPAEAKKRLEETTARAREPKPSSVEVTDETLTWKWVQAVHGAYGIPVGSVPQQVTVRFADVSRLEIYENHYVYIYGPGRDQFMVKILFSNGEDARQFTDLVSSYRAHGAPRGR